MGANDGDAIWKRSRGGGIETYDVYKTAVKIYADTASALKGFYVGKGRLEVGKTPFLK